MTKYLSKPVEVDAWQWDGRDASVRHAVVENAPNVSQSVLSPTGELMVAMADGRTLTVVPGDWIIRRPNSAVSALPDRVFKQRYVRR